MSKLGNNRHQPLLDQVAEEYLAVAMLLRDLDLRRAVLSDLRPEHFQEIIPQLVIRSLKASPRWENVVPTVSKLNAIVRSVISAYDMVDNILVVVRVMTGAGINPSRLIQLVAGADCKARADGQAMFSSIFGGSDRESDYTWAAPLFTILYVYPGIDLLLEPVDPVVHDRISLLVRERVERLKPRSQNPCASSGWPQMGNTYFPRKRRLSVYSVNRAARPHIYEIATRWLPEGQQKGNEWCALNPTRPDNRPSFNVRIANDKKAGCWCDSGRRSGAGVVQLAEYLFNLTEHEAVQRVAAMLGLPGTCAAARDQFSRVSSNPVEVKPLPKPTKNKDHYPITVEPDDRTLTPSWAKGRLTGRWTYRDTAGRCHLIVTRFDHVGAKICLPWSSWRCRDTAAIVWLCCDPPGLLPLFNADQLAAHPKAAVVVCEGEKKTVAANQMLAGSQIIAVSWAHGADGVGKADVAAVRGRVAFVWGDYDNAGAKGMAAMVERMKGMAAEVIPVPQWLIAKHLGHEPEQGWDLADAQDAGLTGSWVAAVLADALIASRNQVPTLTAPT